MKYVSILGVIAAVTTAITSQVTEINPIVGAWVMLGGAVAAAAGSALSKYAGSSTTLTVLGLIIAVSAVLAGATDLLPALYTQIIAIIGTAAAAVGSSLFGAGSGDGASNGSDKVWSIIALLILLPMALGITACSDDQKIKTEDAIRKIYIGLQGASTGIEEVHKAGKIDDAGALGGYTALNQVGLSLKLFKERVRSLDSITVENKVQLIPLLDSLISDIDKARAAGLINIPKEQVTSIEIYYEMAKSGALTLKAVVEAVKKPVKVGSLPAFAN